MQTVRSNTNASLGHSASPAQGQSPAQSTSFQGLTLPPIDPDFKNAIRSFASTAGAGVGAFIGSKLGPEMVQGMLESLDVPSPLAAIVAKHSQPFTTVMGAAVGAQMANDLVDRIF